MSNKTLSIVIGVLVAILIGIWVNKGMHADKFAFEDINPRYASSYDYEKFIEKYPESEYVKNAYEGLYTIAVDANTIEALVYYVDEYPESQLIEDVKNEVNAKCETLYNEAAEINTIDAWQTYKRLTPVTHHKDADERITELETKLWGTDYRAWRQATKENTMASFSKYLQLYPNGRYRNTANQKLIDMQVADVFSKEHGSLPSMNKTGYGYGSTTSIEVYNNTSYTLTLLYSGTTSKRLILSPHSRNSLSLGNGKYRIAASVNASNVSDFAGIEELNGGNYEVEYYIQTQRY